MRLAAKPAAFELVMCREFAAPRERMFAAWTDARHTARWWAGVGYTTLSCEMDVRPDGAWRRLLRRPDGSTFLEYGVFREVVAPERLSFTYNSEGGVPVEPETLVTVVFADLGSRTRLTLHHAAFDSDEIHAFHERGWSRCLDRLSTDVRRR
jgi:uncharacterized protein YndB with AHSA1/START domain